MNTKHFLCLSFVDERQKLIAEVDKEWKQICKKGDTEDDLFDGVNDCIAKVTHFC